MLDTRALLSVLPIFSGLSETQLIRIIDSAQKTYFEPNTVITQKDGMGDKAYLIISGAAECMSFPGKSAQPTALEVGALVGELAMLVEAVYPLTIVAVSRVRALAFSRETMTRIMESDPDIARRVADNLLVRLQALASDLRRFDALLSKAEREKANASAKKLGNGR